MTTKDFIDQAIGSLVYVTSYGDLAMEHDMKRLIYNKVELRLIKWTKGGEVYLYDEKENKYYTVPPKNIREVGDNW